MLSVEVILTVDTVMSIDTVMAIDTVMSRHTCSIWLLHLGHTKSHLSAQFWGQTITCVCSAVFSDCFIIGGLIK